MTEDSSFVPFRLDLHQLTVNKVCVWPDRGLVYGGSNIYVFREMQSHENGFIVNDVARDLYQKIFLEKE